MQDELGTTADFWIDLMRFQFDAAWTAQDMYAGLSSLPFLSAIAERGNGTQPVITFPGFASPELSLTPLNVVLNQLGFQASSWGMGFNKGSHRDDFYDHLSTSIGPRLDQLANQSGQKVSLIGQSLGGLFAREVARDHPDLIDRVITLASPISRTSYSIKSMNQMLATMLNLIDGSNGRPRIRPNERREHEKSPPVPLVALYTRFDGILDWQSTRIPLDEVAYDRGLPRENIEVFCSHGGMPHSPIVLVAICDRLVANPTDWIPFDYARYMKPRCTGPLSGAAAPLVQSLFPGIQNPCGPEPKKSCENTQKKSQNDLKTSSRCDAMRYTH